MTIRDEYRTTTESALATFAAAAFVHIAGATPDGEVLLRTVNTVIDDGALYFHGTPKGEKFSLVGTQVVVSASKVIANIPSYFVDARFACPATTYYVSAMARGVVEAIASVEDKARILSRFMALHQPEGGHSTIDAANPTYRNVLGGLWVARVPLHGAVGKRKLGQNRSAQQIEKVALGLFRRGAPGDVEAILTILSAHPARPIPAFLRGPGDVVFDPALGKDSVADAVDLLRGQYWTENMPDSVLSAALLASSACVGARLGWGGPLVAIARANSDTERHAFVADVVVHPEYRGRGIGKNLVQFLLDHPRVRRVRRVRLGTRDQDFYKPLGFREERPLASALCLERPDR